MYNVIEIPQIKTMKDFFEIPSDIQNIVRKIRNLPFIKDIVHSFNQNGSSYIFTFKTSKHLYVSIAKIEALIPKSFGHIEIKCLFAKDEITITLKRI